MLTLTTDGWRAEVKHGMHRRCKDWDYCKPWIYMITVSTQHHDVPPMPIIDGYQLPEWLIDAYGRKGHPHLFGSLGRELDARGNAVIDRNDFGQAVAACIRDIPRYNPEVEIIEQVVMPNHLHFIIWIKERLPGNRPLGVVVNGFKGSVNRCFKEIVLGLPAETKMNVVQSTQPLAEGSKLAGNRIKHGGHGHKNPTKGLVLEAGFNDRILFRDGQLKVMVDYVRNNPNRLWQVVHNRQYFEKVARWRITMPLLHYGGTSGTGRWWQYFHGSIDELAEVLLENIEIPALASDSGIAPAMAMTFNAMGNRKLIDLPEKMQIQCSRHMTDVEINELIEDVLAACEHGVVIVSPCISPGERKVARAVMDAGYQLIAIFPDGIPPMTDEYKPYGRYFDACARGQLLVLSPWEYSTNKNKLTRWQCLLLNDIAAQLSLM